MKTEVFEKLNERAAKLTSNTNALVALTQVNYRSDTTAAVRKLDEARELLLRWIDVNLELMLAVAEIEAVRNPLNQKLMSF